METKELFKRKYIWTFVIILIMMLGFFFMISSKEKDEYTPEFFKEDFNTEYGSIDTSIWDLDSYSNYLGGNANIAESSGVLSTDTNNGGEMENNCWVVNGDIIYVPSGCTYYIPKGTTGYI